MRDYLHHINHSNYSVLTSITPITVYKLSFSVYHTILANYATTFCFLYSMTVKTE